MFVEADAVAEAMREVFVVRAETSVGDYFASGVVDRTAFVAGYRGGEGCVLGTANDFERALQFFGGLAEDAGARDVRRIAFDLGAAIDQDAHAFAQNLFFAGAVRQCSGWAEKHQSFALQSHFFESLFEKAADLALGQAFFQRREKSLVDVEGGGTGQAHKFKFVRAFLGAAADGDGVGTHEVERWRGETHAVEEGVTRGLFHADLALGDAAVDETFGGDGEGTVVFLPGANFDGPMKLFAQAAFFECGTNQERIALARN